MDNLSNFRETLSELMDERKLTTEALGNAIGLSGGNIRNWKLGNYKLNLSNAIKLAQFFECSLEYLFGRTDNRLDFIPQICPPFHDRLMQIMQEKGKSRYRIVKDTPFSNGYFTRWKNGSDPLMETILTLAVYFDCTLDYLVGYER